MLETLQIDMRSPDRRVADQARAFFVSILDRLSPAPPSSGATATARRVTVEELEARIK